MVEDIVSHLRGLGTPLKLHAVALTSPERATSDLSTVSLKFKELQGAVTGANLTSSLELHTFKRSAAVASRGRHELTINIIVFIKLRYKDRLQTRNLSIPKAHLVQLVEPQNLLQRTTSAKSEL